MKAFINNLRLKALLKSLPKHQHRAVETAYRYLGSQYAFDIYYEDGCPNFAELCDLCSAGYEQGSSIPDTKFGRDIFYTACNLVQY